MRTFAKILACSLAVALTTHAGAQTATQHVDINPYNADGKILTGFYDFTASEFVGDTFRFSEPLEIVQTTFHGVSSPGFFAGGDTVLLPSADLSFTVPAVTGPVSPDTPRSALYWDGLGDVAFADLPANHTLQVRLSRFVNTTVDGGAVDATGFILDRTSAAGSIHKHVSYLVQGPSASAPVDGLYLLPMQLHMAGLESSDTFFLLFNGKYERDASNQIIFDGIIPRVDATAQTAAEAWLDGLFAVATLAGDYNGSGSVEQGDLDLVLNNWGAPRGPWENAQGFTSGAVDQEELDRVLNNWGSSASAPSFAGIAVPEPAAALLAVLVLVGHSARPRHERA